MLPTPQKKVKEERERNVVCGQFPSFPARIVSEARVKAQRTESKREGKRKKRKKEKRELETGEEKGCVFVARTNFRAYVCARTFNSFALELIPFEAVNN